MQITSQHIVVIAAFNIVIRDNKIIPIATELFLASPSRETQILTPIRIVKITNALKHSPLNVAYLQYHSNADKERLTSAALFRAEGTRI
jgi:hypothetical protein